MYESIYYKMQIFMSHDYTCTDTYYKNTFHIVTIQLSAIALSFKLDFLFLSNNNNNKKNFLYIYKRESPDCR